MFDDQILHFLKPNLIFKVLGLWTGNHEREDGRTALRQSAGGVAQELLG